MIWESAKENLISSATSMQPSRRDMETWNKPLLPPLVSADLLCFDSVQLHVLSLLPEFQEKHSIKITRGRYEDRTDIRTQDQLFYGNGLSQTCKKVVHCMLSGQINT